MREQQTFNEAVQFHGHACPGLALGVRAAEAALKELGIVRAQDEELVAISENRSCAVDGIQVVTGCTAGKGNLLFKEYGKQVYTFCNRRTGEAVRLAVIWQAPAESQAEQEAWLRFRQGDREPEIMRVIRARKAAKIQAIRAAKPEGLFTIRHITTETPEPAQVYKSLRCAACNEKVMEPMAQEAAGKILCIPCYEKEEV